VRELPALLSGFLTKVSLLGRGVGTQNYECQPGSSLGRVDWVLFTPQATLFGDQDEQLTTHFFSPNPLEKGIVRAAWQDSRDTSIVWGSVIESSVDPNFVKAGAIPWLKIDVENTGFQAGPTGGDTLTRTTFIQRVNTDGGAAPSTGCDRPTDIGKRALDLLVTRERPAQIPRYWRRYGIQPLRSGLRST